MPFTLLVPATPPHEHATWTEGDARAIARGRMAAAVERFLAEGAAVEGVVGDANPVRAIDDVLLEHPHDEIILSTLPPGISRWLNKDLPHRVEQRFGLPVTTVISDRRRPGRARRVEPRRPSSDSRSGNTLATLAVRYSP